MCPRCGYRLAPIHARKDARRRPIGYCCPEPYCDYVELLAPEEGRRPRAPVGEVSRAG